MSTISCCPAARAVQRRWGIGRDTLRWFRVSHQAFKPVRVTIRTYARVESPSLPNIVRASSDERTAAQLSAQNLEHAVHAVHNDGLVVIENAVDEESLDKLNHRMVNDAKVLQARGKDGPFNYNTGNLQQDPPPIREFFFPSIFLNPFAKQVTSTVLGPHPKWTFCSGNSAMPPTPESSPQRQPVHSDADFAHPNHPFALVVNVPLIDFYPENGSTEIWLGTHTTQLSGLHVQEGLHGERASGRIQEAILEERRAAVPPIQPPIKKGSIIVRDLRLWHAGMPNFTNDVRVMIALIHFAPWYRNPMRLELSDSVRPLLEEEKDLEVPVDWVSEEAVLGGYLHRKFGNAYDFGQTA